MALGSTEITFPTGSLLIWSRSFIYVKDSKRRRRVRQHLFLFFLLTYFRLCLLWFRMNLMFRPQFSEMIQSGRKYHTIRPVRKIPLRIGQHLSLRVWTGLPYRSKQRAFHISSVKKVEEITITGSAIVIGNKSLVGEQQDIFAWHDGFTDARALRQWFTDTHGLPFFGILIYWRDI